MVDLDKYISEQLLKHLNIDYNIIENAGLYDGIEDLCKFLTNKIRSHQEKEFVISYNDSDIELRSMRNIFFKNIILKCERSNKNNNEGEYIDNDLIDFDNNENKLNYIKFNLYLSQRHDAAEVYSILLHEITHAWDEFNAFKNNTTTLKTAAINDKYNSIISALNGNTKPSKVLGQILYFTNSVELNAWIAYFAGYLYNYIQDNQIINPHEALKIIKASDLYKKYINIGLWVKAIYDNDKRLSKEFITNLCIEYNKIYGTNYTEYKVKKLIYAKYNKAIKKIESSIGKLCTRYVKDLIIK